jgi:hypothetical protein
MTFCRYYGSMILLLIQIIRVYVIILHIQDISRNIKII